MSLREQIARIIEPKTWWEADELAAGRLDGKSMFSTSPSLAKADAILALRDEELERLTADLTRLRDTVMRLETEADEGLERLRGALKPFLPIQTRENQDYAEVTFGEHQTQAMTMAPADWLALNEAAVCRAVENKDE